MKLAIILAHPAPRSFTRSMADAAAKALKRRGCEVLVRDLYRMDFDPRLSADEIPTPDGFAPRPDIVAERDRLKPMDGFVLFYPVWFNSPPAILKGYMERVFGMGFGYGMGRGGNEPLLTGKSLVSVSSSGAPKAWMVETGAWDAMRKLYDAHFGEVTGLKVLDHLHFGGIVPGFRPDAVADCAREVGRALDQSFGFGDQED